MAGNGYTKFQLPFRASKAISYGREVIVIEYDQKIDLPDGRSKNLPMRMEVDEAAANPWACRIYQLMQTYWQMEQEHAKAVHEAEVAATRIRELEGALSRMTSSRDEFKRKATKE